MRTTMDLPEKLVQEAMKAAHVKTNVIVLALKELIRRSKISDLKNSREKLIWMCSGNVNAGSYRYVYVDRLFQKRHKIK